MYLDQISCLVTCLCFTRYSFESHAIFFSSDILKSLDFFFTKSIGFLLKYHRNLSKIRDRSLIMARGGSANYGGGSLFFMVFIQKYHGHCCNWLRKSTICCGNCRSAIFVLTSGCVITYREGKSDS